MLTAVISSSSTAEGLRAVVGDCCYYWDDTSTAAAAGALEKAAAAVNASWDGGSSSLVGVGTVGNGIGVVSSAEDVSPFNSSCGELS